MTPAHKPTDWHWWFAWRPVEAECGRWTWLRRVWRRQWHSKPCLPYAFTGFEYHIPTGWVEEQAFL